MSSPRLEDQINARFLKAAKADDEAVDTDLWAIPGETEQEAKARETLRKLAHLWWVKNLRAEAESWLRKHGNQHWDRVAVLDGLNRSKNLSWWEWSDGSRLYFWRWGEWAVDARDGIEFWHRRDPEPWFGRNFPAPTRDAEEKLRSKEIKLWFRRYLLRGFITMIVCRFAVKKTLWDIRAVWDSKRNGHNQTLWAPRFRMPTFRNLTNLVIKWLPCSLQDYLEGNIPSQEPRDAMPRMRKMFQGDMDIGEMFLNFMMHYRERHAFGVRLTLGQPDGQEMEILRRFARLFFGCTCSPYAAVQGVTRAQEIIRGDPADSGNPYQWERVHLNLPAMREYDASVP